MRLQHSPALDGIRAGAVVLVMLYHASLPVHGGHIGVNVFFVLSGFLITSLLLQERLSSGRIAFGKFWMRRVLRLYPALLALIVVVTVYSLSIPDAVRSEESLWGWFPAMLYFSNWVRAFNGLGSLGLYEHTWSLSIEEQFYVVWPIVLWLIFRISANLRTVAWVAAIGCAASLATRLIVAPGPEGYERIFNGLDTQGDQLLFGCLLAAIVMVAARDGWTHKLRKALGLLTVPAFAALLALAFLWPHHGVSLMMRVAMSVVGISAACVIGYVYVASQSWLSRALGMRVLVYIGTRSYGLYLWHYPIFVIMSGVAPTPILIPLELALSFIAAELSFRLIETPFLKIKNRLRRETKAKGELSTSTR